MKKLCVLMFFVGINGAAIYDSNSRDIFDNEGSSVSVMLIDKPFTDHIKFYTTHMLKYFEKNNAQLEALKSFLNSIKFTPGKLDLTMTFNDTKSNPWDSIAPAILASDFELNKADLKPRLGGLSNWGREFFGGQKLTPEQRFMLRLQKALVKKINKTTNVNKILEPLRCLLLANELIPDGFGKKTITEIFNSIDDAQVKEFVMGKIMEQLKSVKINGDQITNQSKNKTLAELVLENITDPRMKNALVRIANLKDSQEEYKWENKENFLAKLIENPKLKFESDFETGLTKRTFLGERSIIRDSARIIKLSDLPPEETTKPTFDL